MDKNLSKYSELIIKDHTVFLNYLKAKFPAFFIIRMCFLEIFITG
jgi:hypothetical protein